MATGTDQCEIGADEHCTGSTHLFIVHQIHALTVSEPQKHAAEREAVAGRETAVHGYDVLGPMELTNNLPQAGVLPRSTFFRKVFCEVDRLIVLCSFGRPSVFQTGSTSTGHGFLLLELHHIQTQEPGSSADNKFALSIER